MPYFIIDKESKKYGRMVVPKMAHNGLVLSDVA